MSDNNSNIQRRDNVKFQANFDALLKEAEALRLSYMHRYRKRQFMATTFGILAVLGGASGFGWFFFMQANLGKALACMILSLTIPLLLHLRSNKILKEYARSYKTIFMPQMAKLLGGFKFSEERGIGEGILRKTGLLPEYASYKAEDCFTGRYNGMKVMFSEAELLGKNAKAAPLFRGLFVIFEAPSDIFRGHSILTSDKEMAAHYAPSRWSKLAPCPLDMDVGGVDKFLAFSSRPSEAEKVLTAGLIKELSEASRIFNNSALSVALFHKRYIFVMIPYEKNMFEASNILFPVTTKTHAMNCKKEIEQLLEIVDIFDLYVSGAKVDNISTDTDVNHNK